MRVEDSLHRIYFEQLAEEQKERGSSNIAYFFFPVLMLVVFIVYKIFKAVAPGGLHGLWKAKRISQDYGTNRVIYDNWLTRYNQYYCSLQLAEKERFLSRTVAFKNSKYFRFHSMKGEEYMEVLISGAAVQLTFGFRNYLLEYFPVINVVRKEYKITGHDEIYEGHVTSRSISISWNNFITGYEDYTDSQNVGLHELAHAISFDVFHGNGENNSPSLNRRFKEYVKEAGPVFKTLRQGRHDSLDDYAAINVEEFWAVAVESFFENPAEFRTNMPGLYDALCELLNQNPLMAEKIIDKKLAGIAG